MPKSKFKDISKNISLLLASLFFILIVTELILRLFYPQNLNYTMFDENLMYRHIPNFEFGYSRQEFSSLIAFNSKGLRDYEHDYKKKGGIYRILILGDSFPEALQVRLNETFPKLMEGMLNKNYASNSKKFEVINAGTGGYGTENEMIFMETEGIKYEPDAALLFFSLNDIEDNHFSPLISIDNSNIIKHLPVKASAPKKLMLYCSRHLHLCSLTQNVLLHGIRSSPLLRLAFSKSSISSTNITDASFGPLDIYYRESSAAFERAFNDTLTVLLGMSNFAMSSNIKFAVAIIPSKEQVDNNKYNEFLRKNNLTEDDADIGKVHRLLKKSLQQNGIAVVDLTPYFKSRNKNNAFYFDIDGHWNAQGHNLAAQTLYSERKAYLPAQD